MNFLDNLKMLVAPAKEELNLREWQNNAIQDRLNKMMAKGRVITNWKSQGRPTKNAYSQQIADIFGEDAEDAERVLRWGDPGKPGSGTTYGEEYGGENLSFDPNAVGKNTNKTTDYGLYRINSATLEDELTRNPEVMSQLGVSTTEDLLNPVKNIKFARYLQQKYGWGRWYGRPSDLGEPR